jgi:putative tricarboxylic transport membrane protein
MFNCCGLSEGDSMKTTIPVALIAVFPLLAVDGVEAADTWKPDKAVEIIALNAPGGGADRVGRIMAGVLRGGRQLEVPIAVVNKPGGGGSIASAYLNQHLGDGHYLLLSTKGLITNSIAGGGPNHTEFTPLVHLFGEYISVTVRPDSPLRNGKDLIDRLRKDPGALSFGIATSLGSPNHQGVAAALKEAGVDIRKMRVVIFPSGGTASTAMLGGHVDVVPLSVSAGASMLRQGQVRMLAVSAPARLSKMLADVPTWREQGYDAVVSNWRGLWGPKGLKGAQVSYWEEAARRLAESDEWKKELEANFWMSEFLRSSDTRVYLDRDYAQARAFLSELGLAK